MNNDIMAETYYLHLFQQKDCMAHWPVASVQRFWKIVTLKRDQCYDCNRDCGATPHP